MYLYSFLQDTAERILMPKYYASKEDMIKQLREFHDGDKCDFVVVGRLIGDRWASAGDLEVPEELAPLFAKRIASFRKDISSTEIRAKQK